MNGSQERMMCEDVPNANLTIGIEKKAFLVYKATNIKNGKIYIGKTMNGLAARKAQHISMALRDENNYPFYAAIRECGAECFIFEPICYCQSKSEMAEKETESIISINSLIPNGYNVKRGGKVNPIPGRTPSGKIAFTVVLTEETYQALFEMAKAKSRPVAQMARVIIEKAVKKVQDSPSGKGKNAGNLEN